MESVERAEHLEGVETADQVADRDHKRADRDLGRGELPRLKGRGARPAHIRPVLLGPRPVRTTLVGAVLQDDRDGTGAGAPEPDVAAVVKRGASGVQRLDQPGQRGPVNGAPPRDTGRTSAPQTFAAKSSQSGELTLAQLRAPVEAVQIHTEVESLRGRGLVAGEADSGGHAWMPSSAPPAVIMPTRCACTLAIARFSLSDNSRPDRRM